MLLFLDRRAHRFESLLAALADVLGHGSERRVVGNEVGGEEVAPVQLKEATSAGAATYVSG